MEQIEEVKWSGSPSQARGGGHRPTPDSGRGQATDFSPATPSGGTSRLERLRTREQSCGGGSRRLPLGTAVSSCDGAASVALLVGLQAPREQEPRPASPTSRGREV